MHAGQPAARPSLPTPILLSMQPAGCGSPRAANAPPPATCIVPSLAVPHLHCPQLRREGAAHAARQDDGGDHGGQLAGQRQRQHAAHGARQAQLGELSHELGAAATRGAGGRAAGRRAHRRHMVMVEE